MTIDFEDVYRTIRKVKNGDMVNENAKCSDIAREREGVNKGVREHRFIMS
tara:strand:- start:456 stop:605 length:150 start_codon:yes stop_codon:yes gene_type:complete